jgi:hypothetical protein
MSKIFEPYFTTKASGSGLGLLIVRRIVREHGGEIDLVSDEGKGLTLTIRFPLREHRARCSAAGEDSERGGGGFRERGGERRWDEGVEEGNRRRG